LMNKTRRANTNQKHLSRCAIIPRGGRGAVVCALITEDLKPET
jgi:hypothetical protein